MQPFPSKENPYINHEMQDAMSYLNETNYWWFYVSTPDLVDDNDGPAIKKSLVLIGRNVLISLAIGITLNVQIKRIPQINFLGWNRFLRWTCRIPILFAPYLFFHNGLLKEYQSLFSYHMKYFKRIRSFQRTGDMRYLDPKGKMMMMQR